jgi:hypothetical protein
MHEVKIKRVNTQNIMCPNCHRVITLKIPRRKPKRKPGLLERLGDIQI